MRIRHVGFLVQENTLDQEGRNGATDSHLPRKIDQAKSLAKKSSVTETSNGPDMPEPLSRKRIEAAFSMSRNASNRQNEEGRKFRFIFALNMYLK